MSAPKHRFKSRSLEIATPNIIPHKQIGSKIKIGPYYIGKKLGQGTFGLVRLGTHIQTGEKVAIKILEKNRILENSDKTRVEREIKILKSLHHKNIARLYSVIQTSTSIYLVMEYAEGSELFEYIVSHRRLNEYEACKFYHDIINGIDYIHQLKIAHRDIKPENLLLDANHNIKIVDFGLSNLFTSNELLQTACGSPCYAAPEMINRDYYNGNTVDIWSSGVVLFAMLCGYLPFEDDNTDKLYDKIINGKFSIPDWISPKAKSFLLGVLDTSPERRFTVEKIRESEWYNMYQIIDCVETLLINKYVIPIDESIVDEMNKKFCYRKEEIRRNILGNHHNYITSMYYLILKRKTRNGDESISDLSSVKFVSYIKDSGNLLSNYNNDIDIVIRERAKKLTSQRSDITNTNSTSASLTVNEITNVSSFERFVIERVPAKQIASRNQTMLSKTKPVSKINTKKFITVHNSKANISRYNKLKPKKKDNNKKFNIKCNFFNTTMTYEKDENKNKTFDKGISLTINNEISKTEHNSEKEIGNFISNKKAKIKDAYYLKKKSQNKRFDIIKEEKTPNHQRKANSVSPYKISPPLRHHHKSKPPYESISSYKASHRDVVAMTIEEIVITPASPDISIYANKNLQKLKKEMIDCLSKNAIQFKVNKINKGKEIMFCRKKETEFVINIIEESKAKRSLLKFKKIDGNLTGYRDTIKKILNCVL